MKPIPKQNIILGNSPLNAKIQLVQREESLPEEEFQYVVPRMFPNPKIPLRVLINRKVKQYSSFDLNEHLGHVDWGKGDFFLANFIYADQYIFEYGCSEENISKEKVRGRAYNTEGKKFEKFIVTKWLGRNSDEERDWFIGYFIKKDKQKGEEIRIHRSALCLDFQDPTAYVYQVQKGIKRRKRTIQMIKYEFYIDNMDLHGAPMPSQRTFRKIKQLTRGLDVYDIQVSYSDLILISNQYRRSMNQLLFRHQVKAENLPIKLTRKNVKYQPQNILAKRQIKFVKDNKVIKLIPKTVKKRVKDFSNKTLFINEKITLILVDLKQRLNGPFLGVILFKQLKDCVIERFYVEQQRQMNSCYAALQDYIVTPIAASIKDLMSQHPDGWFRQYSNDYESYMSSKLKRMIILMDNLIKDTVKEKLVNEMEKFHKFLKKYTPQSTKILSVTKTKSSYEIGVQLTNVLSIELQITGGQLELSHSSSKISEGLKKVIRNSLQMFKKIPSLEPYIVRQIVGNPKLHQGVKVQMPQSILPDKDTEVNPNLIENNETTRLQQYINKIDTLIEQIVLPLSLYQQELNRIVEQMDLSIILLNSKSSFYELQEIVEAFQFLNRAQQKFNEQFCTCGVKIGFFYIDFAMTKRMITDHFKVTKQSYHRNLLTLKSHLEKTFNMKVKELLRELQMKPNNVHELVQKNRKINNLDNILEEDLKINQLREFKNVCEQFGCRMKPDEIEIENKNKRIVDELYGSRESIEKQFGAMKKAEKGKVEQQKEDIQDNFRLIKITLNHLSVDYDETKYKENAEKIRYIRKRLEQIKKQNEELNYKLQVLEIQRAGEDITEDLFLYEQTLQPLQILWSSIQKWRTLSEMWLYEPVGSFKLVEPELQLKELIQNFKKVIKDLSSVGEYGEEIANKQKYTKIKKLAQKYRKEIEDFEPKLRLLKIIKKEGFTQSHLRQIDIILTKQVEFLSLNEALEMHFLDKIDQIETVSNEAWNQFSLEQTLSRVTQDINMLKFQMSYYLDKKQNKIYMITNLKTLIENVDSILSNLESVQFNPMKALYQSQIKLLYEKSLYISNSIKISEQFQQIFIEIHPIFDSTDIVKQMPSENKQFAKLLRVWLQLLGYINSICSVNDACSSQNIYEKVKSILVHLEKVKKSLIEYLERKRQGFSRFYLLSNSELFELFANSSEISKISSIMSKLFDSVSCLLIDHEQKKITGVSTQGMCQLTLTKPIEYQHSNLEIWMNSFQKELSNTILNKIEKTIHYEEQSNLLSVSSMSFSKIIKKKNKEIKKVRSMDDEFYWLDLIRGQDEHIPQVVYVLFEIQFTKDLQTNIRNIEQTKNKYERILASLVQQKKSVKQRQISKLKNIILCSLILMCISKIQICQELKKNKVNSMTNFEYKKVLRAYLKSYSNEDDDLDQIIQNKHDLSYKIIIGNLDHCTQYGCHYLGVYSRLVITSMTERMILVYMLANWYSLGCAAIGPAGTGKSQTTKQIARLNGKTCLIYNCSEDFDVSTLIRLMKGLSVVGLWMCFDQFNRLSHEIFSVIAEQLSFLLKIRNFRHRMEINFAGDLIWLEPSFQFSVTYNPTYQGRQTIPQNVHEMFRNMALVKPDQLTISVSLLLSSGFLMGQQLGEKTVKIFRNCRKIWQDEGLYDFSLRALKSIIDLGNKLLIEKELGEENAIISALNILNLPKMNQDDRKEFSKILKNQFPDFIDISGKKSLIDQRLADFQQIIDVRDGILLCGESLSGKKIMLKEFITKNAEKDNWNIEEIYHDVLFVEELYGKLDHTTRLWTDGIFTQALRKSIQIGDRPSLIIFNGSVYSQWVQNLNSVLDSTRKLSLSSGETINIPNNFKIVISCNQLTRATPATISRSGVIVYQESSFESIATGLHKQFPKRVILFFKELLQQLKNQYKYKIQPRFIIFWVASMLGQNTPINYDTFIYFLSHIMEGILTHSGKEIYDRHCRGYLSLNVSPFKIVLKSNKELGELEKEFKKHLDYDKINSEFEMEEEEDNKIIQFESVFIKTEKYYKISEAIKHFQSKGTSNKILVVFSYENSGKSKYISEYLKTLPPEHNKKFKIFMNKKTSAKNLFESVRECLTKKSSNKLGGDPGFKNNIFIEDFNMPLRNRFEIYETCELARMVTEKCSWYNYQNVTEESLEDIGLFADAKLSQFGMNPLNMHQRMYRHINPMFLDEISEEEIVCIFLGIFQTFHGGTREALFKGIIQKMISWYLCLKDSQFYSQNIVQFNLMDLRRSLKGILAWNITDNTEHAEKICLFELSRTIFAKIQKDSLKEKLLQMLSQHFSLPSSSLPLIHNLEGSDMVKSKYEQITDLIDFTNKIQYICDEYRTLSKEINYIIVFPDMVEYLIKIYRTLSSDYSHCMIVGLSKCGKKNLIKLASYLVSSQLNTVNDSQEVKDWHESIKIAIKSCYKTRNLTVLLFEHRQIQQEYRINEINTLLNSMDLPKIYSEADNEEIIYMTQTELVRNNIPITRNNAWKQLLEYLKRKMHIVLLFNPIYHSFSTYLLDYPSLLKYCSIFYIKPWPQQGLNLIGRLQMADLGFNLDFLPKIHDFCAQMSKNKNSVLVSIWEGMYFNFVTLLRDLYEKNDTFLNERKNVYEKGLKIIEETEQQLTMTKNKIKKLQPTILLMESETSKTVKNLHAQKKAAKQTNEILIKKREELEKIITESKIFKAQLQIKVQLVNQKLEQAWENVSLIKPNHISEVKVLSNPSEFIKTVLSALVILTYDGPLVKQVTQKNGHQVVEDSYFQTAKKHVLSKDAKSICRILIDFKRENVSKEMFAKLEEKCLFYKRWSEKQAKSANKAIYYFFLWVDAVSNQYRIYEETRPLREQLNNTTNLLNEKEQEIIKTSNQLDTLQAKISELEQSHAAKKEALSQYRRQIAKFERMLTRGYELLKQIEKQKDKWKIYITQISKKLTNNFGDSVLMASSIIYLSPHIYEVRKIIKEKIKGLCREHGINCGENNLPWLFTRDQTQHYYSLQINENEFIVDNLKIIQHSPHFSFLLLDPEEQGINYIKKLNWQQLQLPMDKISELSPLMIKQIESGVMYGRIIFLEVNPEKYNEKLGFVIKPMIINSELKNQDKSIPIHPNFKLYLYSTSFTNKTCSMQLLANTQVVNFKMTIDQLSERIMEAVVAIEMPLLKSRIQEIFRVNTKDIVTLSNIQQKLLSLFSKQITAQEILESQQIIGTVIHSNRLYKQIQNRITESNEQKEQISKEIKPYQSKVKKVCLMYENIFRLKFVSPMYSYSYQWFIELFEGNIHNFEENLFKEVSKALKTEQKIIVAILIAEITHPTLPWRALFNSQQQEAPKSQQINIVNLLMGGGDKNEGGIENLVKKQLGLMIRQLPVSQEKWNKIVSRVKNTQKYIKDLEQYFINQCDIFKPLIKVDEQHVLEAIPNQFSELDFFYRIILVSCFRPEFVLSLLRQWIKINMGPNYIDFQPNLATLINNTKPNRPIILTLDDPSLDPLDSIKQMHKKSFKGEESSTPVISLHWTPNQKEQFRNSVRSGVTQDQWIMIEGANNEEAAEFIKTMFEQIIILPQKIFRIFVVRQENGSFSNRFTYFCDKIRIIPNRNMKKNITESFFEHYGEIIKKDEEFFEKSKKKLLINQICILHHILEEFNYYNRLIYQNNKMKPIYSYTQWDLKLIFSEVLPYEVENTLKQVIYDMICNLTYGSQIRNLQLRKLLQINSKLFLEGIITDRNAFWQTIWSDEKFPKDMAEYEHEIKNRIAKEQYMQIFGINKKVREMLQNQNYERICQLYEKTTFHKSQNIAEQILNKIIRLEEEIVSQDFWSISREMEEKISQLKRRKSTKSLELYFKKQLQRYTFKYNRIVNDLKYYKNILSKGSAHSKIEAEDQFIYIMFLDKVPASWTSSKKSSTPLIYLINFAARTKELSHYIYKCQNIFEPIHCDIISSPHSLLTAIFQRNSLKAEYQNYYFVLEGVPLRKLNPEFLQAYFSAETSSSQLTQEKVLSFKPPLIKHTKQKLIVKNLYCWNFSFIESNENGCMITLKGELAQSSKKKQSSNQSEVKVAGGIMFVERNKESKKVIDSEYVGLPLLRYSIEDIAEDYESVITLYVRHQNIDENELIRRNCHFSLSI